MFVFFFINIYIDFENVTIVAATAAAAVSRILIFFVCLLVSLFLSHLFSINDWHVFVSLSDINTYSQQRESQNNIISNLVYTWQNINNKRAWN